MGKPSPKKVEAKPEITIEEEEYACGNHAGTLYGPAEYLDEKMRRFRHMNYQEYVAYDNKVDESGGFDVDGCTGRLCGGIAPLRRGSHEWEVAEKVTRATIANLEKKMAKHINFVDLMKANVQPVQGVIYYLTFAGTTNGVQITYKVKVWNYPTKRGIECHLLYFADESEEKDIEAQNIKFYFGNRRRRVVPFRNKTTIKPKSCLRDAFHILVEELRRQHPELTCNKARSLASSKWKQYGYPEKCPYIDEAWIRFKKKNPKYYPEYANAVEEDNKISNGKAPVI